MTERISPSALWEETTAFVRAEGALLLPIACLGFGLPLVMVLLAVPVGQAETGRLVPGPWMWWLLPAGLLAMTGSLAISALALRPGGSVGEALRLAVSRLPGGIGLMALNIALQIVLAIPLAALAQVDVARAGQGGPLAIIGNFAAFAAMIWVYVRLMPIWALLAVRGGSPVAAVRACLAITRGRYRALLLLRVVGAVAGVVVMLVVLIPLGALIALLGLMIGDKDAVTVLSYVLTGFVFALLAALWTVFVARLYRRLAGSSSGI